jgi:hypothetical protein
MDDFPSGTRPEIIRQLARNMQKNWVVTVDRRVRMYYLTRAHALKDVRRLWAGREGVSIVYIG